MEITRIGPVTGAEARAYLQPITAARQAPRATRIRIRVWRKGRDNYFFSDSSEALASAASGEAGSTAITRVMRVAAPLLSPDFIAKSPSL